MITLVGYMMNNCILGTAADAGPRGIAVEVLFDVTGAIALSNAAGAAELELRGSLLLLQGEKFTGSDLVSSRPADLASPGGGVTGCHLRI